MNSGKKKRELSPEKAAMRDALRLLRRRPLGCAELRDRLARKGHESPVISRVVAELMDQGALDDAAYAKLLVESELRKPTGRRLLVHKLCRKRVPREVIGRVVTKALRDKDPVADARSLAERKLTSPTFQRLDAAARQRRLWSLLARRGFDRDVIETALGGLVEDPEHRTSE
jgi:regulatory protein